MWVPMKGLWGEYPLQSHMHTSTGSSDACGLRARDETQRRPKGHRRHKSPLDTPWCPGWPVQSTKPTSRRDSPTLNETASSRTHWRWEIHRPTRSVVVERLLRRSTVFAHLHCAPEHPVPVDFAPQHSSLVVDMMIKSHLVSNRVASFGFNF